MSTMLPPNRAADEILPPNTSATKVSQGTATSVTTSAQSLDLLAAIIALTSTTTAFKDGGRFITFQARGSNVYVRFGPTSTTATTAGNGSNGVQIPNGSTKDFWITSETEFLDYIGDAACTLFWWQSSPNYDHRPLK